MTDVPHASFPNDKSAAASAADFSIYGDTPGDRAHVAVLLRAGAVVALPTETVYGLAADALNPEACRRIFEIKGRPLLDPLIVHVADLAAAEGLAEFNAPARALAAACWPGPLTLVLPKRACVPAIVTAGLPSVALRVPAHPAMHALLAESGLALAAPSANPFGYISPTCAAHVRSSLAGRLQHLLDGGPCAIGVESTILDLRDPTHPRLLRPGGLAVETAEAVLGTAIERPVARGEQPEEISAPGLLKRHYSPRTPLSLHAPGSLDPRQAPTGCALLLQRRPTGPCPPHTFWLSEDGDLGEVARHLFDLLRRLDADPRWTQIRAEYAPAAGLGLAINDRLTRAAAQE